MAPTQPDAPAGISAEIIREIIDLLSKPPKFDDIEIDPAYFNAAAAVANMGRRLLPAALPWQDQALDRTDAKPRIPLQLCEFLAYRTALAYETPQRLENYLQHCCDGHSRFKFFDSHRNGLGQFGVLADSQGYGFVFERKAFVIFRGTTSGNDWKINSTDSLTDDIMIRKDHRYMPLRKDYGPLLDLLGDPEPGRHIGFSIAWAALKEEVEDWLADVFEAKEADQIVYSGHSLGGAIAQLAAFDHARIGDAIGKDQEITLDHIAAVVTFGAPAVGNKKFTPVYRKLLGDRTILLESSGDLVPRIMDRWYYKMLYPMRQRVDGGVRLHVQESDTFGKVTVPWTFVQEPPLSTTDIDNALSALAEAAKKAAADLAEKQAKESKEKQPKSTTDQTSTKHEAEPQAKDQEPKTGKINSKNERQSFIYYVFFFAIAFVVTICIWAFVRRKMFSHDIEQRYALYLSTLSYQHLRAKHKGDLDLANAELKEHLRFIRGDLEKGATMAETLLDEEKKPRPFCASVRTLPVEIKLRHDPHFLDYQRKQETFV